MDLSNMSVTVTVSISLSFTVFQGCVVVVDRYGDTRNPPGSKQWTRLLDEYSQTWLFILLDFFLIQMLLNNYSTADNY